jgi:cysteine desulfurase/selenocysteine lyase
MGVLYGKRRLLEKMPPNQGGGEMIKYVSFEKTTYNDITYKFEEGTPNIGDAIAFIEAINFINTVGKVNMRAYENELVKYAHEKLFVIPGLRIIGTADQKITVVSFVFDDIFHFDIGQLLDARGIAVRTGHHCTQPLMGIFGIEGTVRASFSVYNTKEEIDRLAEGLERIVKMMK